MPYLPMPLPAPYTESRPFWDRINRQELAIRKCQDCGAFHHPPLPICPKCQSERHVWEKMSGKGRVECFTICHRGLFPGFPVPYNVVRVELEDARGIFVIGNLIDCEPEDIKIGLPVTVTFEEISAGKSLYYFKKDG